MHVTKMHGARNDFVVVDGRATPLRGVASFARWACDRRAGIGADGVILLEPSQRATVRMRTINADGTEAEMCGNGIRCAARWLDESGEGDNIAFETDAGIVGTEIVAREPEYLVRVAMGRPRILSGTRSSTPRAAFVDLGNPHVVIFESNLDSIDLNELAKGYQNDPAFSNGTNVHLAAPLRERLAARYSLGTWSGVDASVRNGSGGLCGSRGRQTARRFTCRDLRPGRKAGRRIRTSPERHI